MKPEEKGTGSTNRNREQKISDSSACQLYIPKSAAAVSCLCPGPGKTGTGQTGRSGGRSRGGCEEKEADRLA